MRRIAIVGMGCSGALVLRCLSEHLKQNDPVELFLFEQSSQLGAGLAYSHQCNEVDFILNMQAFLLSANPNDTNEFSIWLQKREDLKTNMAKQYVQRSLMGEYLEEVVQTVLNKLKQINIACTSIQDTVLDINQESDTFIVRTQKSSYRKIDRVVLAIGHLPRISPLPNNPRYIANPYHSLNVLSHIHRAAKVGIVGSKLRAVDIALILKKHGVNHISMLSRSGRLPLVRGVYPTTHNIPSFIAPKTLSLRAFLKAMREQITLLNAADEYKGFINCEDASVQMELENQQAKLTRQWQFFLDRSKEFIDEYWANLSPFHKQLFIRKYHGMWMTYRHPMAIDNAKKINAMLQTGELQIHAGYKSVSSALNGKALLVKTKNDAALFDYVIDATDTPSELIKIDSPLIRNLVQTALIRQHEFGGVEINTLTHELENVKGMFILGHLTKGKLFYVSAIERLLVHAQIISRQLLAYHY